MIKYELINYFDVWGNKKDGFEVNNLCSECFIEVNDNYTHKDLIQTMKLHGFLTKTVRVNMFDVYDDYEFIEFTHKKSGKPVCRLELKN